MSLATPRFSETEVAQALGQMPDEFLGGGTFGDTWRVGPHAVKIICVDVPEDRLNREIDGLGRVDSEYVVKLVDVRDVPLGGESRPALVFEYVPGRDVQHRIDDGLWPTVDEGRALLQGLLQGLFDLHGTGTVHRDIKPANIALRDGDWARPVILDLGLARGINEPTLTVYPACVGTVTYMAPEVLRGSRAKKAADLFAAGVTVRYVLGKAHPFFDPATTRTHDDLIRAIEAGPPALPADVPAEVAELLDRLVAIGDGSRGSAKSGLKRLGKAGDAA